MKQLLTYVSSDEKFNAEHQMAAKIQIDNSLELGWKKEDILLATNFPYEYNGVKSYFVPDLYCKTHWPATKIYVIDYLFKNGLIKGDYWYHDFDCFQLSEFPEKVSDKDIALTNYGRMPRLCSASIFFKDTAGDIFEKIKSEVDSRKKGEEEALGRLMPEMKGRFEHLNITYAFHKFNLLSCWKIADKPIKAVHFHLTPDKYDFYVRGHNKLKIPLIPERLIKIFNKHGYER